MTRGASRIKYELNTVNIFNKDDWDKMIDFMTDSIIRFEKAFNKIIQKMNQNQREIGIIKNLGTIMVS